MKQVKRWRYYCDYCKKSSGQKAAMARHEKGCTANPDRICGMCEHSGQSQADMSLLTAIIETDCVDLGENELHGGSKIDCVLAALENEIDCPACVLAAIRQAKIKIYPSFNFKRKAEEWWAKENELQEQREHAMYY